MTTQPDTAPRPVHQPGDTGRCQHCQQTRPLYPHSPAPLPWEDAVGSWLCARDYSAAVQADDNEQPFHIEHDLVVWPEQQPTIHVNGQPITAPAESSGSGGPARDGGGDR